MTDRPVFPRKYAVEVPRTGGGYAPVTDIRGKKWGTETQATQVMGEVVRRGYRCRLVSSRVGTLIRVEDEHEEGAMFEEAT